MIFESLFPLSHSNVYPSLSLHSLGVVSCVCFVRVTSPSRSRVLYSPFCIHAHICL